MLQPQILKRSFSALCLALVSAGLMPSSLQAQELETIAPITRDIKRLGVGLNGGFTLDKPFLGAEISFRPSTDLDRLRVFAKYDFLNAAASGEFIQRAWLGVSHDFYETPEFLNLRAYGFLMAGLIFGYSPANTANGVQTTPGMGFGFMLGFGAEIQLFGPLWAFGEISTGAPLVRPELGLRLTF